MRTGNESERAEICGHRRHLWMIVFLLALTGCGGGGSDSVPQLDGPAPINTLVYVDTACRDGADGFFTATQELRLRRGESAPVTVVRVPMIGPMQVPGACQIFGVRRDGSQSPTIGAFQRLGISPDGTAIIFEVTDDLSSLGQSFVPPEQKGIFFLRADGGGLRRLGDASRVPAINTFFEAAFRFSPNGRFVDFSDIGPGSGGQDAAQVFVLDVATGKRTQVTHLQPAPFAGIQDINLGPFLDDRTIVFGTFSNLDGHNPDAKFVVFTVSIDDGELKAVFSRVALPGSQPILVPVVTGFEREVFPLTLSGVPINPMPGFDIREVFIFDGTDLLQLTDFGRIDTSLFPPLVSVDGERVFVTASVNPPLNTNPLETCQIFSVDALGGDLRQLTRFDASRRSVSGCLAQRLSQGCVTDFNYDQKVSQDVRTGTLVFVSSCDPFGTNPNGEQIFAIRPDGGGLRPLTETHSLTRRDDGSVEAELPGPWSYGPHR